MHRSCMCERGMTRGVVMEDAPFGVDLNIVIGFVASQNEQGMFKVWVDGELMYSAEGTDFGFGQWEADDTMNRDNTYITLKLGMYNHDDETYTRGEERTVWCALSHVQHCAQRVTLFEFEEFECAACCCAGDQAGVKGCLIRFILSM